MHETPRSRLAVALHIWVDLGLALVALATAALILWMAILPFQVAGRTAAADGAVWVGVGNSSLIPVHRLELAAVEDEPFLSNPRLVKARGELRFHTRRLDLVLLSFLPMLLVAGAVLAGGWQLRQVLAAVAGGSPFDPANPRRIAAIGWIIVAVTAAEPLLAYVPAALVLRSVAVEGMDLSPVLMLDNDTLLVGLLVLVLSVVFREGTRLHEEQSLTV